MKKAAIAFVGAMFLAATAGAAQDAVLIDPEIAAVLVAANQVDADAGRLAQEKASSQEVKNFAKRMATEHDGANREGAELFKKANIQPKESASSTAIIVGGKRNMEKLKGLQGASFDKAYMENEVTMHQTVLDTIDKSLLPNVKNEQLKGMLNKTRPLIAEHLQQAKKIHSSLGKSGS